MSVTPSTPRVVSLLMVGYLVLGMGGLVLAIPPGYASPVFPAAGLALACLLRFGWRAAPGVWLGSFLLNLSHAALSGRLSSTTAWIAAVIAVGATAQAGAGRLLVVRFQRRAWEELEREQDAVAFLLLGGLLAGVVSASVSVTGLLAAGVIDGAQFRFTWWTWYVGDVLGVLVFAPLVLCFLGGPDRLWNERRRRVVGPMVLVLGLVALTFHAAARWEATAEQGQLEDDGEAIARRISDRLITHREVLASLRNFMQATPGVTFPQFERFTRITLQENADISALSFNDLLPDEQRPGFEETMGRLSPLGAWQITERDAERRLVRAGRRSEYVTVRYIVPLEPNRAAVGFDIQSEPIRRKAIAQARSSGGMSVTSPIRLVQERAERVGMLELLPVSTVLSAESGEAPRLVGFAVAVIKVDEMMAIATRGHVPAGLAFELVDPSAPSGTGLLFRSEGWSQTGRGASTWTKTLGAGNQGWVLSVVITEDHFQAHRPWVAWAVGVVGLLFAALFQVLMLGVTGRTAVIERKNEALRANEARLLLADKVFENSGSSIVVTDPEGVAISVNPTFTQVTGYGADEVRGQNMRIVNSGRHPPEFFREMWRSLREEHRWQGEVWNRRKNGDLYLEVLTIQAVRSPEGTTTHYVGSFIDITERRAMEERLATSSRLAAMGTLVAGVAHEINNPLAGAMGAQVAAAEIVSALRDALPGGAPIDPNALASELGQLAEAIADAQVGSERIARIVKDLTVLGKPDAKRARVRLSAVVEEAMRWLPASVPRNAALLVEDAGAPDVEASSGQLAQVLINLVVNAAKAIPTGRQGRVVIRIGPGDPGRARIEVADNGTGMGTDVLARIFDPFYTTRRPGEGTGLGLPICHAIITAHGGTIVATSVPGEGTTFRIEFPALPQR
ncbi:MAG: CHASE domain-containing protein [Deltaproteobacteria bacterium]